MESKNRNVLIAVIVFLLLGCCCVIVAAGLIAASVVPVFDNVLPSLGNWDAGTLNAEPGAANEWTIPVGTSPVIDVSNFAGLVSIRAGEANSVYVHAVKRAVSQAKRNQIQLSVTKQDNGVTITAKHSPNTSNSSVRMEITVPPDSILNVRSGAGTINIQGIHGALDLTSGAGTIVVKDAQGSIQAQLGAGEIIYEGTPSGNCSFHTGAGNIMLKIPSEANLQVELSTGIGGVKTDFDVKGHVSTREITGTIGDGTGATLEARTGTGAVTLSSLHR